MSNDQSLTITTAVQQFRISRKTVRRLLDEGAIVGARAYVDDDEMSIHFPAESLERLGYQRRNPTETAAAAAAAGGPPPARRRSWWPAAVAVLLIVGLIGAIVVVAGGGDDDGEEAGADPVWEVLGQITAVGEPVGVTGSGLAGAIPPDRPSVRLDEGDELSDLAVVVVGDDAPSAIVSQLELEAAVTAVDRDGAVVRVFDRTTPPDELASPTEPTPTSEPQPEPEPEPTPEPTDAPEPEPTTSTTEAAPPPEPTTSTTAAPTTTTTAPAPAPEPDPAPDPAPAPTPAGQYTVVTGDNFWDIAEATVLEAQPDASQAQVTSYWLELIDANADQLVEAGNADLILPGQVFELPPVATT